MRLPQFLPNLGGRPSGLCRLYLTPDNLRAESEQCAKERRNYFLWPRRNPAAYQNFLNRAGGIPVEKR